MLILRFYILGNYYWPVYTGPSPEEIYDFMSRHVDKKFDTNKWFDSEAYRDSLFL